MGYTQIMQKVVLHISLAGTMPNKALVKEVLKSQLDKGNGVYDIALGVRMWEMGDIWLYCTGELLTLNKFKDCEDILVLNKLSVLRLMSVGWNDAVLGTVHNRLQC
eukprot:TRINITY_DN4830_c0_g1_i1.p1 TRINITY_DN4830_c0_g1~~TRINITY_DN4830_c0_g1_i1.p1  ORF type:complete len:106 (+),score=25.18 TRINITY_DN4830_c0_g1_i1:344-661(+)